MVCCEQLRGVDAENIFRNRKLKARSYLYHQSCPVATYSQIGDLANTMADFANAKISRVSNQICEYSVRVEMKGLCIEESSLFSVG